MKTKMHEPNHSETRRPAKHEGNGSPPPGDQGGFSLIEALITLLVMSVGLLGIVAMQVIGIQETAGALRHSQATWFAYDMADRIRANINPASLDPIDTSAGAGDIADHYEGIDVSIDDQPPAADGAACDGVADNCNAAAMANFDAFQWWQMIQRLPRGQGTVTEEPGVDGRYLVRVMWDETKQEIRSGSDIIDINIKGCPSDTSVAKTCVEIWVEP